MFLCRKCGCATDTAEEFREHMRVSHSSSLDKLVRRVFRL